MAVLIDLSTDDFIPSQNKYIVKIIKHEGIEAAYEVCVEGKDARKTATACVELLEKAEKDYG